MSSKDFPGAMEEIGSSSTASVKNLLEGTGMVNSLDDVHIFRSSTAYKDITRVLSQ